MNGIDLEAAHGEVLAALQSISNPRRGEAVQRDRGSALQHLGIGFPTLRARVKQGFSFSKRPAGEVLAVWDALWQRSPVGDVLFAALAHYEPVVRKQVPAGLWPVLRGWHERVDNWCHADMLAGLYSRMLQAQFDEVYPQLQAWNAAPGEWQRRLSITSLVHYTGKNAVFLAPAPMLPLLAACAGDLRPSVQMALGWVLRELGRVHPREAAAFLQQHGPRMSAKARARSLAGNQAATLPST